MAELAARHVPGTGASAAAPVVGVLRTPARPSRWTGITGLWQVNGRSQPTWTDAVRLDLYYVENRSIVLDLAIPARTAGAVLRGTGAH